MTRQQAKREACHHAAMQLETNLGGADSLFTDVDDQTRYEEAMNDLIRELRRRGGERDGE
jgi:membrane-bound ClpP family serine protease